ncbi:hypothetical protein [Streptomyces tritici]|uniref:hypothetical protein n=1 Tax=Streptomyces tritici TaxID=2054410 RepID=UPI003AF08A52
MENGSVVEFEGTLGRTPFRVLRTGDRRELTIGDRSVVLTPDTRLRHRNRWVCMEIRVTEPGRPDFVHRYSLGLLQWAALREPDYLTAELGDPGLELVAALGGTTDWVTIDAGEDRDPSGPGPSDMP